MELGKAKEIIKVLANGMFVICGNKQHGRNTADAEGGRQFLFLIRIYFVNVDLAGVFIREFLKDRDHHLAGLAPIGIKINDAWQLTLKFPILVFLPVEYLFKKCFFCQMFSHKASTFLRWRPYVPKERLCMGIE